VAEAGVHAPSDGLVARAAVAAGIAIVVLVLPALANGVWEERIALAAVYAIIGLSINLLTGYAGQVSLGHQAFVGLGAFTSALVAGSSSGGGFLLAVAVAGLVGAGVALVLGRAALRLRALYVALVTFAFGRMAEATFFRWRALSGGPAGRVAPRPSMFHSDQTYAYLCLVVLGVFLLVDWRLAASKAGRALLAIRADERTAASMGIDVDAYRSLAFAVSGFLAGVAGSLFAHLKGYAATGDFDTYVALIWVAMAVVGGLRSRAGVVIGSAFFALFPYMVPAKPVALPLAGTHSLALVTPVVGGVLLVLTVTLYPGGIGGQLLPVRRWLAGGSLVGPASSQAPLLAEPVGIPGAFALAGAPPAAAPRATAKPEQAARFDVPSDPPGWSNGSDRADPADEPTIQLPPVPLEPGGAP